MGALRDGLQPPINGTEERLDRVLAALELLLARAGAQPASKSTSVVKLVEPQRAKKSKRR